MRTIVRTRACFAYCTCMLQVNKADGDLLPAARRAKREYLSALKLLRHKSSHWSPTVLTVSAVEGSGVDGAWESMLTYYTTMLKEGEFESKRRAQARLWMWTHVTDHLMERFKESDHVRAQVERIQQRVESGELTSGQGADMLLEAAFRRD
eukprot:m.102101 g.102101  ORF g.102101 m.102101 type:complete len:151 (+) comp10424_c1_seq1:1150-1602(+)